MGLYEESPVKSFFSDPKNFRLVGITVAVVVIVVLFYLFILPLIQMKPLVFSFRDNPFNASQKPFTVLNITVTNTTGKFASLSTVKVEAEAKSDFLVGTNSTAVKNISNLGAGEKRELIKEEGFSIRPNPARDVLPGTYNFRITFEIDGQTVADELAVLKFEKS